MLLIAGDSSSDRWWEGRLAHNNLCHQSPYAVFLNKQRKKSKEDWSITQVHSETQRLQRSWWRGPCWQRGWSRSSRDFIRSHWLITSKTVQSTLSCCWVGCSDKEHEMSNVAAWKSVHQRSFEKSLTPCWYSSLHTHICQTVSPEEHQWAMKRSTETNKTLNDSHQNTTPHRIYRIFYNFI